MNKKNVGIIGAGNIGSALLKYIDKNMRNKVSDVLLFDIDTAKIKELSGLYSFVEKADSVDALMDGSNLVIETACAKVVPSILNGAIEKGKDIILLSIGGLLGNEDLLERARKTGINVMLPSGAISGVDALKAARISGIKSVSLTTRKAPRSLKGAPYLDDNGIDVEAIDKETTIFEGNAIEAMKGFPKNINVSALLSIVGIGAENTEVKIIVSPEYKRNIHEIEVVSEAGQINTITQNVPSPDNPKTSYLAVLAAMASIDAYFDSVKIGT